jgi:hypothetical protein
MPDFNPVFIAWGAVPKRTDLLHNYSEFLKAHPKVENAASELKRINELLTGYQKVISDGKDRTEKYELMLEENEIGNLVETEPLIALKRLRAVIERRRTRNDEKFELLVSLTGLGEQLDLLGFAQDVVSPLEEAMSLSKTLAASPRPTNDERAQRFSDHVPNPRLPELDPEIAMAKIRMESGDFDGAEELIRDAIQICDHDKNEKFESIRCRFILIDCLVPAEKLDSSQKLLVETSNMCKEQNGRAGTTTWPRPR